MHVATEMASAVPARRETKISVNAWGQERTAIAAPSSPPRRIRVECLEESVAASAVRDVRISWAGRVCYGTVLRSKRSLVFAVVGVSEPDRMMFTSLLPSSRQTVVIQGRAGAVAGVLCYCRPARSWHWVPWCLVLRQDQHRWIPLDDPAVLPCGEGDSIDFARILSHRLTLELAA